MIDIFLSILNLERGWNDLPSEYRHFAHCFTIIRNNVALHDRVCQSIASIGRIVKEKKCHYKQEEKGKGNQVDKNDRLHFKMIQPEYLKNPGWRLTRITVVTPDTAATYNDLLAKAFFNLSNETVTFVLILLNYNLIACMRISITYTWQTIFCQTV